MNQRSEIQPASVAATGRVWRVAYPPDPWAWVPWEYAPFHGRFDDARGQFRVLYAGTTRLACYLEVTAQFRPDLTVLAERHAAAGQQAQLTAKRSRAPGLRRAGRSGSGPAAGG